MPVLRVPKLFLIVAFTMFCAFAVGAILFGFFFSGGAEKTKAIEPLPDPVVQSDPAASKSELQKTVLKTPPQEEPAQAPRLIAPDVIPVPPVDVTVLQRAEPREQLIRPKSKADSGWEMRLLYRPIVSAAGRIEAAGHAILIDGIKPVQPGETCPDRSGKEWPCGNLARTALRGWVRGRAIHCRVPEKPGDDDIVTSCELGGQDIATWLVRNGWAQPHEPQRFDDATKYARSNGLGIFKSE